MSWWIDATAPNISRALVTSRTLNNAVVFGRADHIATLNNAMVLGADNISGADNRLNYPCFEDLPIDRGWFRDCYRC